MFGYLGYNDRRRTMFETEDPDIGNVEFKHNDWIDIYLYTEEYITLNTPVPMNNRKLMSPVMMYTGHMSDLINRGSVTGFLLWLDGLFISGIQNTEYYGDFNMRI